MKKSEHKCRRPLCGMPYLANAYCSLRCADLDKLEQRIEHLRAGIEAYRRAFEEFDAEYSPSDFLSPETLEAMRKWEREERTRNEKG